MNTLKKKQKNTQDPLKEISNCFDKMGYLLTMNAFLIVVEELAKEKKFDIIADLVEELEKLNDARKADEYLKRTGEIVIP